MSGLSPVAAGILMGSISGAAMGFMTTGTPMGAAAGAVIGGVSGGLQADKAEDDRIEGIKNQKRAAAAGVKNQNALVENEYRKSKNAAGLDTSGTGNGIPPQSGAVLESVTGGNTNTLIG